MSHGRFDNPVIAALHGFYDLFRKQKLSDRFTENDRFDGKTVLITGANSGLGFGVAVEVARRGGHVIMACRSQIPLAGEKAKRLSGSTNIEMRHLDLTKLESIHAFCAGLKNDGIKPDVTILNAGVTPAKSRMVECGQDEMFFVNYLSNVMLTNLLISEGTIDTSPGRAFRPRILFISSDSHQGSSSIDYDEFGRFFNYGPSKAIANYSYFKLLLNTYSTELSRRVNKGGEVVCGIHAICPGPVNSNIVKEAPFLLRITLKAIFSIIFRSPAKAALPVAYMAISPDYEGKTNEYLHMFRVKRMDEKVYIPEEGAKLWERSVELWKQLDPKAMVI
jgi:NAD(P)-dependent dehydrogenase (short-subunit alcohol dehydrogenase family)